MSASGGAEGTRGHGGANKAPPDALTIFPKHPSAPDTYYIGGAWAPAAITATDKRFTEAELAAAHWKARALGWPVLRADTLYRFAKLPHHDQEDT